MKIGKASIAELVAQLKEEKAMSRDFIVPTQELHITEEGESTLSFFENRISDGIKEDVKSYLKEKSIELRNEVSITSEYYRSTNGEYAAHLSAKEKGVTLVDITLSIPLEDMASSVCDNWQKKNKEIYKYLTEQLF